MNTAVGYPGAAICAALHEEGWDVLFQRMLQGARDFRTHPGFAAGVLLTVPPFPQSDRYAEISKGLPILFREPPSDEDWRHMHLSEVEMKDGRLITAGELGSLMIVTGTGTSVEDARAAAYRRCHNVVVPGLRYRADIGARFLARDRALMQEWGLWPKAQIF